MIIYYSGTGNSLQTAQSLAKKTNDRILSILHLHDVDLSKETLIGFVFPVYNYTVPPFIQELVEKATFPTAAYTYFVTCHGGDKGNSIPKLKQILAQKGIQLHYGNDVKMPVNSRIMYGRVTNQIEQRIAKSEKKLVHIATDILAQKNNAEKFKRSRILDCVSNWVSSDAMRARYTPIIDTEACVQCGICQQVCPVDNIYTKTHQPLIGDQCVQCMTCMHWCPQTAIHYPSRQVKMKQQYHHPQVKWTDIKR